MNVPIRSRVRAKIVFSSLTAVMMISPAAQSGEPLGSGFAFQGQLNLTGVPVNDSADFSFTLWDAESDGAMIGAPATLENVTVVDGLFTVDLDFGVAAFNGEARWVEIDVRSPAGSGAYTTLSPRQPLSATPYSLKTRGLNINTAGNVGIGATNPQHVLHTIGDLILVEGDSGQPAVMLKNTAGGGELNATYGLTADGVASLTDADNNEILFLSDNKAGVGGVGPNSFAVFGDADVTGRLGVGTSAPSEKLHVAASGAAANVRLSKDNNSYTNDVIFSGSGTQYNFGTPTADRLRVWNDDAGELLSILPNGNVGIGATNPTAKLQVNGDVNATALSGNGSGLTNVLPQKIESATGLVRVGSGVEMYTRSTLLDLDYSHVNNYSPMTDVWQSFTAGTTGDLAAIDLLRNTTLAGTPGSAAVVRIYDGEGISGALLGSSSIPPSLALGWQSASFPTSIPIVAGQQYSIRLTGATQLRWAFHTTGTYPDGMSSVNPGWDQGFRTYVLNGSEYLTPVMVANSDGKVGIGTTSPAATLDVNGSVKATSFSGNGSAVTNAPGTWGVNGEDLYYNDGNVVIGSAETTDSALSVDGIVRMSNTDILFRGGMDNNHGLVWSGSGQQFSSTMNLDGPVLYGYQGGGLGTTSGDDKVVLFWKDTGRVGIGTSDPVAELDVRGDIQFGDDGDKYTPGFDRPVVIVSGRVNQDGSLDTTAFNSLAIEDTELNSDGKYTVYFVDGTFTKTPVITVAPGKTDGGAEFRVLSINNASATEFHVSLKRDGGHDANGPFSFTAIGE